MEDKKKTPKKIFVEGAISPEKIAPSTKIFFGVFSLLPPFAGG